MIATAEEAECLYSADLPLRDFGFAHPAWVTDAGLTDVLRILRDGSAIDLAGLQDQEALARFDKIHVEFAYLDDDEAPPFCAAVPHELVERVTALSPVAAEETMRMWGNTRDMRFGGKWMGEERYWEELADTFGEFRRLCQSAQATGKGLFLYIEA